MYFQNLILLFNFIAFCSVVSLKNDQFCEKDEKTGLCKESQEDEEGPCWYSDPEIKAEDSDKSEHRKKEFGKLYMIDGVKIRHEQEIPLNDRSYKLITRAMVPPVFEIPNFLDDHEIENILLQANEYGLFSSRAKGGLTPKDLFKASEVAGKSAGAAGDFYNWDMDENDVIDMNDVLRWNKFYNFLVMNESDVHEMFKAVGGSEFDDELITREEFETLNTQGLEDYINQMIREHPRFRQRYSEQVWLPFDKVYSRVLHNVRERLVNRQEYIFL